MVRVFIGIGSNMQPEANIRTALQSLQEQVTIVAISTFYLTAPVKGVAQPSFINGVVEITTTLSPVQLKYTVLRSIEAELGRQRSEDKYAPRPIDLDLLLYDGLEITSPELTLPDPDIAQRAFLAIPLCEIAPDIIIPDVKQRICDIAQSCPAILMEALSGLTAQLRALIMQTT